MRQFSVSCLGAIALLFLWQYIAIRAKVRDQAEQIESMRKEVELIELQVRELPTMIRVEFVRAETRVRLLKERVEDCNNGKRKNDK